jgi:uncharacterized protein (TIGR02246 family)
MIGLRKSVRLPAAFGSVLIAMSAGAQPTGKSNETAKVTAAVDQMLAAWNRRDYQTFSGAFTEDGDFVNARGGRVHGRKAIAAMAADVNKKGSNQNQVIRHETATKMVKPDVALVLAGLTVKGAQAAGPPNPALGTFVLVKAGGIWRITALEIAPGPAATAKPPK